MVLTVAIFASAAPASSQVTKDDVEDARARRDEIQRKLDDAAQNYEDIYAELELTSYRVSEFRTRIDEYEVEIRGLQSEVQERAVAAYMKGNFGEFEVLFEADTLSELAAGREFLQQAAERDISLLDRLTSVRNGLDTSRVQLEEDQARLRELEAAQARLVEETAQLFAEAQEEFQDVAQEFEEQERARREEERRRRLAQVVGLEGAAAGAPASSTPGFICFFDPPYSFINDWGFPRSGGRTHKGTDVVAAYGQAVRAVADGVVHTRTSELGGISVWLDADYGTSYYYAHLSGYADGIANGTWVAKGTVVGYNGDSGNAKGGVPHVHFQIHPGGRGSQAVNPYPTLVAACL